MPDWVMEPSVIAKKAALGFVLCWLTGRRVGRLALASLQLALANFSPDILGSGA